MTNPRDKKQTVSKVNQPPRGLQSLLGNVNQGVNPHELDHNISPGVDLLPFWAVDKQKSISNSATVSTVLGGVTIAVPAGKLWRVRHIGARMLCTATDEIAISIEAWYKGTSLRVPLERSPTFVCGVTGEEFSAAYSPGDLWYSGGTTFTALCAVFVPASGTRTLFLTIDYTEISE